jgi:glycyl-tRNA synthetase beta chain
LARTIIESGFDLNLNSLLNKAVSAQSENALRDHYEDGPLTADQVEPRKMRARLKVSSEVRDFIFDRLRGYYADRGVPVQHFNAVAELRVPSLYDFDRRIDAIGSFAALPEAEALAAANKRIRNILKKAEGGIPATVDPALLREPAERALAEAVEAAYGDTGPALAQGDYVAVLGRLARLRPQVDAFFDQVMVNVDDAALRDNRLALLQRLAERLGSVAAIEHLSA